MVSGPVGRDEREGIYVISVIGSTIRLLRDNARQAAVSHDGTKIAFADADYSRIWVMDADGQQVRPIVVAESGYIVGWPKWSNDGRRISYFRVLAGRRCAGMGIGDVRPQRRWTRRLDQQQRY